MSTTRLLPQPRRIAMAMLLVWLFATLASWVNACLVQPSAAVANPPAHHQRLGAIASAGGDHHAVAESRGADEPDPARQACASFCETEQSVVVKAQPSKGDLGSDAAMSPPAAIHGWPAYVAGRAEPRRRPRAAPPPPGPPVAIAFLRLTL